jgi:dimethylhistidine N-methyltransferase
VSVWRGTGECCAPTPLEDQTTMTMSTTDTAATIEVHLDAGAFDAELRRDAEEGLRATPRWLAPTWLYDERGCALFEAITELPEYYQTRTERGILADHAGDVARQSGADTLVELGSGTSEKTRLLLDALATTGQLRRFVPFDVAEPTLRDAAASIAEAYPGIDVTGIVGDFRRHLPMIPAGGRRLFVLLGGTIGNFPPAERHEFLSALTATMRRGDSLLLGTDLVKDPARLVAAYDDAAGVTAAFDRNVLHVLNDRLGADFVPERFTHVAHWDATNEWIEMRLRSAGAQVVTVPALGLTLPFADGEELRTEISAKFRRAGIRHELRAAGLHPRQWWTDPDGDFAVSLARR